MARNGEDESFAAYAPSASSGAAAELGRSEEGNDVAREIAKAMPWLKPEEIDALRKEQELIDSGAHKKAMAYAAGGASFKHKFRGGKDARENEFADYVVDDSMMPPVRNIDSPRKLVHDNEYTDAGDVESDKKMSNVPKTGAAKNLYSRRGMQEDDESAAALPDGKEIQTPATVGQWNVPTSSDRSDSNRVGAVAVQGPGGTNRTPHGGASSDNTPGSQSLISAELVTEGETLNTDQIRQMLRSELQAELQNNIVRAEVITPVDPLPSNDDVESRAPKMPTAPPNETSTSEQPGCKKRYYIFGLVFVLIVGAAGGAAGALLAGGSDGDSGGDTNANIVGATEGPATAPSLAPVAEPTIQVTSAPTVQSSTGGGQPPNPTLAPTTPPTNAGENKSPTLWPSQFPTSTPSLFPTTWAPYRPPTPTPPPATQPPTRAPTDWPTLPLTDWPTRSPTVWPTTLPPTDTDPPTRSPTYQATDPPTIAPIVTEANPPTANPTDPKEVTTDPPTREPTIDPTRPPTEEEVASPSSG